jgi:hypothetical protein
MAWMFLCGLSDAAEETAALGAADEDSVGMLALSEQAAATTTVAMNAT